jgi:hypothetical protein
VNDADYPALYRDADAAAQSAQRRFLKALGANLALLVVAATLSLLDYPDSRYAAMQVLVLSASIALSLYLALGQPQRAWYGTRALAESIKTVTWRFMMRAEPYNDTDAAARERLIGNIKKIIDDNMLALAVVRYAGGDQITQTMQETRQLALAERKTKYDTDRIGEQLSWYERKTRMNSRSARVWFGVLVAVECLAVLAAIGRVLRPGFLYWPTDVLAAAAGGILAWLQRRDSKNWLPHTA